MCLAMHPHKPRYGGGIKMDHSQVHIPGNIPGAHCGEFLASPQQTKKEDSTKMAFNKPERTVGDSRERMTLSLTENSPENIEDQVKNINTGPSAVAETKISEDVFSSNQMMSSGHVTFTGISYRMPDEIKPTQVDETCDSHQLQDSSIQSVGDTDHTKAVAAPHFLKDDFNSYQKEFEESLLPCSADDESVRLNKNAKPECDKDLLQDRFQQASDKSEHDRSYLDSNMTADERHGHLKALMDLFESLRSLGIEVKPKMYTRLDDEKKRGFSDYIRGLRRNGLFSLQDDCDRVSINFGSEPQPQDDNVVYCKNLFLKDRKGQFYLVIVEESCCIDLKLLKNQLNASRNLSFADEKSLFAILGLKPGEVTPFSIMRESAGQVRVAFHESLAFVHDSNILMAYHPFSPYLQVDITFSQLIAFMSHCRKELEILVDPKTCNDPETLSSKLQTKSQRGVKEKTTKSETNNMKKGKRLPVFHDKIVDDNDEVVVSCEYKRPDPFPSKDRDQLDKPNRQSVAIDLNQSSQLKECKSYEDDLSHMKLDLASKEEIETESNFSCDNPFELLHLNEHKESQYVENTEITVGLCKVTTVCVLAESSVETSTPKPFVNERIKIKRFDRKGKLKSFMKQLPNSANQAPNEVKRYVSVTDNRNIGTEKNYDDRTQPGFDGNILENNSPVKTKATCLNEPTCSVQAKDRKNVFMLSPKAVLPEIEDFYNSLKECNISFREIDISLATSQEIGPSLGVKCFLFKDQCQNYFLVVSHEFYEPDFGRLKEALQPKKRLDPCDILELPIILGVDCQHFTPFALISRRSRANNIHVYLTEKIMKPSVILCIKHPFAEGRRLVISSSDLQIWMRKWHSGDIGVVTERAWLEKYNIVFSQFNCKVSEREREKRNEKDCQTHEKLGKGKLSTVKCRNSTLSSCTSRFASSTLLMPVQRIFTFPFRRVIHLFARYLSPSTSTLLFKVSDGMFEINHSKESSVDSDDFEEVSQVFTRTKQDTSNHAKTNKLLSLVANETTENERLSLNLIDTACGGVKLTPITNNDLIECEEEDEMDYERPEPLVYNSELLKRKSFGFVKVSVTDVVSHLSSHCIRNRFSRSDERKCLSNDGFAGTGDFVKDADNYANKDDNDDDSLTQICYTQHLWDPSDNIHYLIVGRDLEHIHIKRFCRRFNIRNRLYVIDEAGNVVTSSYTIPAEVNPFNVYLSTRLGGSDHDPHPSHSYRLVLYSSIHMDPSMKCEFETGLPGTRLSVVSAELQHYSQLVGMQIWRMP